jgi:anti-sigma B factor antagonist
LSARFVVGSLCCRLALSLGQSVARRYPAVNNVRNAATAAAFRVRRRGPPSSDEWAVVAVPRAHYPVLWTDQTAIVSLPAEIDIINADQVREDLLSVLNQGAVLLIADLSKTTFCDSAGVGALARTFRRAEASRSEMRLVVSTRPIARVLSLTGIDRLLDIYPSVSAALAGPHRSPTRDDRDLGGNAETDGGAAVTLPR